MGPIPLDMAYRALSSKKKKTENVGHDAIIIGDGYHAKGVGLPKTAKY